MTSSGFIGPRVALTFGEISGKYSFFRVESGEWVVLSRSCHFRVFYLYCEERNFLETDFSGDLFFITNFFRSVIQNAPRLEMRFIFTLIPLKQVRLELRIQQFYRYLRTYSKQS